MKKVHLAGMLALLVSTTVSAAPRFAGPLGSITYLDLVKQHGTDPAVALIEEITNIAPEFTTVYGRTILGTSTILPIRRQLPTADFRRPNEGVVISKSEYDQKSINLAFLDVQMRVDIALISADNPKGRMLAREASGAMRSCGLRVGTEFYYGSPGVTEFGFPGLQGQVDSSLVVDATGSTANTGSSVYFIVESDDDVCWLFGNNGRLGSMSEDWPIHKVYGTNAAGALTAYDAYTNAQNGWLGLQVGMSKSVARIKNLTAQTGKGLTDALGQTLLSQFPTGKVPTKCFMTRRSRLQLQLSRTAVSQQAYALGAIAPVPVELAGVPITITDSILNTEAIG